MRKEKRNETEGRQYQEVRSGKNRGTSLDRYILFIPSACDNSTGTCCAVKEDLVRFYKVSRHPVHFGLLSQELENSSSMISPSKLNIIRARAIMFIMFIPIPVVSAPACRCWNPQRWRCRLKFLAWAIDARDDTLAENLIPAPRDPIWWDWTAAINPLLKKTGMFAGWEREMRELDTGTDGTCSWNLRCQFCASTQVVRCFHGGNGRERGRGQKNFWIPIELRFQRQLIANVYF